MFKQRSKTAREVGNGEYYNRRTRKKQAEFAAERDWEKFHSPRNLLLALVGEVGELSEIFQWRGEVSRNLPGWEERDKVHLGEELSDVLLYLIRLSDICGIDLGQAALRKLQLNAIKYPIPHCTKDSSSTKAIATTSENDDAAANAIAED
ncbi:MazG nucleotide pyrophosphohydrolase [Zostera marina]|uniref:dCTP pyrophosphatase 1 n=1 Tax=Zostera marina TaxID=29655 RepID=A0A0K9NMV7_ZOSMR|nr:MazG nucleotide pyrophosphohydrolase [Zostera marina]